MIVITGAAGFIGSNLVARLNRDRFRDVVVVDDFSREDKMNNLVGKTISQKVHRERLFHWIGENHRFIQIIIHLGARTDTAEFRWEVFETLNLGYSMNVWKACVEYGIPLIYASSAATYGNGELGYDDSHDLIPSLRPLNPYGKSKNDFDKWALEQRTSPFFWAGLKFFNVYGPNEYHKGRMASVVYHAFQQILRNGEMKLFRSHRPDYGNGEQQRDFIYVKDVVDVISYLMHHRKNSGIYNLGSGRARSFNDLAATTFKAMLKPVKIRYIDTPEDIRDKYQYFTQAPMQKLRTTGYSKEFTTIEDGIGDYVKNYLSVGKYC